jgi:hypothetical protein
MADRVCVELPAIIDQPLDHLIRELIAEIADEQVEVPGPAEPAQHRARVDVVAAVAVVEGEHDRLLRQLSPSSQAS